MKIKSAFVLLTILLIVLFFLSLGIGKYPISPGEIIAFVFYDLFGIGQISAKRADLLAMVLWDIRLPRILAAALIGAGLSVSGGAFQTMFTNPLVSPGILGVLAGASFGTALGMLWFSNWIAVQSLTFVFGFLAVFLAVGIARFGQGDKLLLLILGGVISSALFTSLLSVIKYVADPYQQLPAIVHWLMGGLSQVTGETVLIAAIPLVVSIVALSGLSGYLNAMSMGEEEARTLGVNIKLMQRIIIFFATVAGAVTVVLAGMIQWVGLVIPHVVRMLVGPDNRIIIPFSALIGAIYLIIIDDFSRIAFNSDLPIGILTSLVGIPFFIVILRKAQTGWR